MEKIKRYGDTIWVNASAFNLKIKPKWEEFLDWRKKLEDMPAIKITDVKQLDLEYCVWFVDTYVVHHDEYRLGIDWDLAYDLYFKGELSKFISQLEGFSYDELEHDFNLWKSTRKLYRIQSLWITISSVLKQ